MLCTRMLAACAQICKDGNWPKGKNALEQSRNHRKALKGGNCLTVNMLLILYIYSQRLLLWTLSNARSSQADRIHQLRPLEVRFRMFSISFELHLVIRNEVVKRFIEFAQLLDSCIVIVHGRHSFGVYDRMLRTGRLARPGWRSKIHLMHCFPNYVVSTCSSRLHKCHPRTPHLPFHKVNLAVLRNSLEGMHE